MTLRVGGRRLPVLQPSQFSGVAGFCNRPGAEVPDQHRVPWCRVSCPVFLQSGREPLFFRRVTSGAGSFRGAAVSIQGERCGGRAGRYSCSRRITRRPGTPNPYPRRSATFGVPILLAQVRVCSPRRRPPHLSRLLKILRVRRDHLAPTLVMISA